MDCFAFDVLVGAKVFARGVQVRVPEEMLDGYAGGANVRSLPWVRPDDALTWPERPY